MLYILFLSSECFLTKDCVKFSEDLHVLTTRQMNVGGLDALMRGFWLAKATTIHDGLVLPGGNYRGKTPRTYHFMSDRVVVTG